MIAPLRKDGENEATPWRLRKSRLKKLKGSKLSWEIGGHQFGEMSGVFFYPIGSMYGIFTYMNGEKWRAIQGEMAIGKYSRPMDPMGTPEEQKQFITPFQQRVT